MPKILWPDNDFKMACNHFLASKIKKLIGMTHLEFNIIRLINIVISKHIPFILYSLLNFHFEQGKFILNVAYLIELLF